MLATGGTIATLKTEEGKVPQLTSQELLRTVPEIREICQVEARQLFQLDSTNVHPEHWKKIARAILEQYDAYDGFVITHGTDTMAYTAAALSYMLPDARKPIVLTGAQNSIGERETDGRRNLLDAFLYASSDCAWGVTIVFDGQAMLGTRAKNCERKATMLSRVSATRRWPASGIARSTRCCRFPKDWGGLLPIWNWTRRFLCLS